MTNEEHTYKRGNMSDNENETNKRTKSKEDGKETDLCECQAFKACKTRRCLCKKSDSKCNNKYKCKNIGTVICFCMGINPYRVLAPYKKIIRLYQL